jgi:hypothetical protein
VVERLSILLLLVAAAALVVRALGRMVAAAEQVAF